MGQRLREDEEQKERGIERGTRKKESSSFRCLLLVHTVEYSTKV